MTLHAGQVALVTGSSSGIGRAIALELASRGINLCLLGRNAQALRETAAAARLSPKVRTYPLDITNDNNVADLATRLEDEWDGIDILIHSAGIIHLGTVEEAGIEILDRQYRVNVRAPFLLTQILLPCIRRRAGQIAFINSSAGLSGHANTSQYAATKHALKAIADSLREEVNAAGIRVLSVFPGRTATPMQAAIFQEESRPYEAEKLLQPEDVAIAVADALSLPETAETTEISIRPRLKS